MFIVVGKGDCEVMYSEVVRELGDAQNVFKDCRSESTTNNAYYAKKIAEKTESKENLDCDLQLPCQERLKNLRAIL